MNLCFEGELLEICYVWMYDCFSGFIKFWSSERNTENTMSHLYFNEESDYSEEYVTIKSFTPPFSTAERN